jgi:menaquinone-dependent protoporphyrinogen oxidase
MSKIIILYFSVDGQTKKISSYLQEKLIHSGNTVVLSSVQEAEHLALASFDKIVLAASIRYGNYDKLVYQFVAKNKSLLVTKPNAFITVNVTARKPGKDIPETNPYVKKFLKKTKWKPLKMAIFAGRIHYAKYSLFDRTMIKFIMKLTKGPTAPNTNVEFTDWDKVDSFCHTIASL